MALVYRHRRLDTGKVFYVGIGSSKKRAYCKNGRNDYWNKIVKKAGYQIEIVKKDISREEACELEEILISEYGRVNNSTGCLCNMTDGGEGAPNVIVSLETRNKLSKANKGYKHTPEAILKIRKASLGRTHSKKTSNKRRKPVTQFSLEGVFIRDWGSAKQAEVSLGIGRHINSVCKGRRKTTGGYTWKYKE